MPWINGLWVEPSDNTRVQRQEQVSPVLYHLKPGETFIKLSNGKIGIARSKNALISLDNRSDYQKKQDSKRAPLIRKRIEDQQTKEEGIKQAGALVKVVSPSTYIGAAARSLTGDGTFGNNLVSGEGFGDETANLAFDITSPFVLNGLKTIGTKVWNWGLLAKKLKYDKITIPDELLPLNFGWMPKLFINVKHTSYTSKPITLFKANRWDVINEGANPHGIWYLGKLGTPRIETTNPGKGIKAEKARAEFENRPYSNEGILTLEKPMGTVGEVPNRSLLSWYADLAGSDGIIYNNVYDNGYNNNQVIQSFKLHEPDYTQANISPKLNSDGDFDLLGWMDNLQLDFYDKVTEGFARAKNLLGSKYWKDHLVKTGLTEDLAQRMIDLQLERMRNYSSNKTPDYSSPGTGKFTGKNEGSWGLSTLDFDKNTGKTYQNIYINNISGDIEATANHEIYHLGNLNGKDLWLNPQTGQYELVDNVITRHNSRIPMKTRLSFESNPNNTDSYKKYLLEEDEKRVRALIFHQSLERNGISVDEFFNELEKCGGKLSQISNPNAKAVAQDIMKSTNMQQFVTTFNRETSKNYLNNMWGITGLTTLGTVYGLNNYGTSQNRN